MASDWGSGWGGDWGSSTPTLIDGPSSVQVFFGLFKKMQEPVTDLSVRTRDIANPQTLEALSSASPDPNEVVGLATFVVDDRGDYAFDEGLIAFKKRILRRLITRKGAYAHLPEYGVGIPQYGKRLSQQAVIQEIIGEAEKQIALEPETLQVKVKASRDLDYPGLVVFTILVRTITGQGMKFDAPFSAT